MINGGDVVRPESNRSVSSEWENLKDCGRCGSCPLKDVRALSSRGAKTGWASEAEKIVGAKAQGGQLQGRVREQPKRSAVEGGRLGWKSTGPGGPL